MKRSLLRFPTGQQFRRIVEDEYEWAVITDTKLRILDMERGEKGLIPRSVTEKVHLRVSNRYPNKRLEVFDLHSHPASRYSTPSWGDLRSFISDLIVRPAPNVYIKGHGVITKNGIFIMMFPDDLKTLMNMKTDVSEKYEETTKKIVQKKFKKRSWGSTVKHVKKENIDAPTQKKILHEAHKRAIQTVIREEPQIDYKMVRRTHRGDMRRLRR